MNRFKSFAALAAIAVTTASSAGPTAEQVRQLGTTLTPWGAEIAGNKDGSIPAYTGGVTKAPTGFDLEGGKWVDPFAADKPVATITAANLAQHADKLLPSTQEMLRRWTSTYRVDVYPTRRSYPAMAKEQADAAIRNAQNPECKTTPDGVGLRGCSNSTPFPLPATGNEVIWNHLTRQRASAVEAKGSNVVFDSAGVMQTPQVWVGTFDNPYWDTKSTPYQDMGIYYARSLTVTVEPARDAGLTNMVWYPLRMDIEDQRSWSYTTGQRRVRLAPEFAYDTPIVQLGGVMFFDEANAFAGRMDRFDYKLVGKKEVYVPYNSFKAVMSPPEQSFAKHHLNPDVMRWELHRVWVVEATLKPGQRHALSKRRLYVDEDSWFIVANEGYDQAGKLVRAIYNHHMPNYSGVGGGTNDFVSASQTYDLARGNWCVIGNFGFKGAYYRPVPRTAALAAKLNPQALAGAGVR